MSFFLLSFTSLFTLMNPFGVVPVFMSMTVGMDAHSLRKIAMRACVTAALCLIFFSLTGHFIFSFFNISIDSLRVVGGVLFFIMGYDMLQARIARLKDHSEGEVMALGEGAAISPLAIPMISGPGSITAVIVMMKDAHALEMKSYVLLAVILAALLCYVVLIAGKSIVRVVGDTGNKVFLRLMGLIVMMTAVEFFFAGIKPFVKGFMQ